MKLTLMVSTECAEYSRGVSINNIAHIYVSTEAVWRARWINWKWTFSHKEMSISNLFSGPYILLLWTFIFMQIIQYYDMKLTWMDPTERAEYSRSVFINNIAHIYVSTEAVWRARWINWKWTFSHKEMSISNLFSGPYILLPWTFIFMQIIQYYDMKLTWMDPVERAECSRSVFINNIAHIYVSTEAVWRCPFPIYSAGPTYCFRGQ